MPQRCHRQTDDHQQRADRDLEIDGFRLPQYRHRPGRENADTARDGVHRAERRLAIGEQQESEITGLGKTGQHRPENRGRRREQHNVRKHQQQCRQRGRPGTRCQQHQVADHIAVRLAAQQHIPQCMQERGNNDQRDNHLRPAVIEKDAGE